MALDTTSQLMSAIYMGIGQPPDEILSRVELANIIFRRLAFRLEAVRQSEQGEAIAKTTEFTLASDEDEKILTDLETDFVIPMWAEYKSFNFLSNPVWLFLPNVNLSMLQKQRALGNFACSFYGGNSREVIFKSSLFGNEITSFGAGPTATIQVFYAPSVPFPTSEDATVDLPNNLLTMVQYDAMVSALPLMTANAAKLVHVQPQYKEQMDAWQLLYVQMSAERKEYEHFWDKWRTESRGAHRPRSRPDILANRTGGSNFPWFVRSGN